MRPAGLLALVLVAAFAQASQSGAVESGVLLERDANSPGQFSVRSADHHVLRYRFDDKTQVEREDQITGVVLLNPGDRVEVVSDGNARRALTYAISVRVIASAVPALAPAPTARRFRATAETRSLQPVSGSESFSGVAFKIAPDLFVLRLRDGVELPIRRRPDTRYLEEGSGVDGASLRANMRVTVLARRTPLGDLEAYQVLWGRILRPE